MAAPAAARIEPSPSAGPARDLYVASAQQILIDKYYNIPVVELTTVLASSPDVFGTSLGADPRLSPLTDAFVGG